MARLEDDQGDVPGPSTPISESPGDAKSTFPMLTVFPQGYELTEEEVRISLDDFRAQFSDPLGAPEYPSPAVPHLSDHVN